MWKIIGTFFLFAFLDFSIVQSNPDNTPSELHCDIPELLQWGYSQTSEKWLNITKKHSFSLFCNEVNVLVRNLGGCVEIFSGVVRLADDTLNFDPLDDFMNYLAIIQHYCSIAKFSKMCDEPTAIWGCAVATVGTVQDQITGSLEDLEKICKYYNQVVEGFELCANSSMEDCTADQKTALQAGMKTVLNYFKTGQEYCLEGCGDAVALIASRLPGCEYIIDYSTHTWDKYCEYLDIGLNCIYQVWNACPIVPGANGTNVAKYRDEVILYADLLGCRVQLDESTIANINTSVSMPDCVWKSLKCAKRIAIFFGLTDDNSLNGGYSVSKANQKLDLYLQQLIYSKSFYEICKFINQAIWDTIEDCTSDIVVGCKDHLGDAGFEANIIITDHIGKYIDQACAKGCTDLVQAFENLDTCTEGVTFEGITVEQVMIDVLSKILFTVGEKIKFCEAIYGYVECVLPDFKKCDVIYNNWVDLISLNSNIKWSIAFCNIQVNLDTGEFELLDNPYNGWLKIDKMSGSSMIRYNSYFWCIPIAILIMKLRERL